MTTTLGQPLMRSGCAGVAATVASGSTRTDEVSPPELGPHVEAPALFEHPRDR